ncbi:hypothetical protein ACGFNV_44610 [Streptomyces sp. NPDC048751]|uniref:hypothetical protein n=1 Tax=Streptomyces sp. NPDC048751 TaxID=3365591 RepID=UPI003716DACB
MRIATCGPARVAVALTAACLTAATGCSSNSGDSDSDSKVLRQLAILADGNGTGQVTYLDVATARKLDKEKPKRFGAVGQPGTSLLTSYRPGPWGQHLEVTQIDTTVDSAKAGRWEGSFDVAAITKSMKANGYAQSEKDGKTIWTASDDSGVSFQISKDEITYSQGAPAMSGVKPKEGASLADKEEYQRAAECLGDVYRADFAPLTSAKPKPVRLSVLGQRADSAAENTEVLCFVTKDEATAKRLAAELRSVVRDKSPRYDGAKVTVGNGDMPFVRAAVPDTATQRPGRLATHNVDLWMAMHDL